MVKQYYSIRTGKHASGGRFDINDLRRLFVSFFSDFENKGYFQQSLGTNCVDGFLPGLAGEDVATYVFRKLKKDIWPIYGYKNILAEDDIFDLIEFLYDHVAKGIDSTYHNWNNCGYHYSTFDRETGQADFREFINEVLRDYGDGFELSPEGYIVDMPGTGLENLFAADLPPFDSDNVEAKVTAAIKKFRRHNSTYDERKDAIRDLADVLEYLRPKLKKALLSEDENDLFNIVNNFGIRHHNQRQKIHYDKAIWYSWMFYYYLATIHATVRLLKKQTKESDHK